MTAFSFAFEPSVEDRIEAVFNEIHSLFPGLNLERVVIYGKERLVAKRVNALKGTDYEASLNSAQEGVDLISRSGKFPPIQVKSCVGTSHNQGAGDKRGDIVEKAQAIHPDALIALVRFEGGNIERLFLGSAGLIRDLDKPHISFPMVERWGFEDLSPS